MTNFLFGSMGGVNGLYNLGVLMGTSENPEEEKKDRAFREMPAEVLECFNKLNEVIQKSNSDFLTQVRF